MLKRPCLPYMEPHQRGWRYTGLGRAVKLSSTVVLPPSTAGSAHIRGPKEAKDGGTNPSIAIKHTSLPQRKKCLLNFLFYHSFLSFLSVILGTIRADSPTPTIWGLGKLCLSPECITLCLAFFYLHFT